MNENINYISEDDNDSCEGMGAIVWILASLVVMALTVLSIIAINW